MSELRDVLSYDLASLCRRLGSELVTDTDGRARQTFAGGALALAEKDGRSGVEVFGLDEGHDHDEDEERTIVLSRELALQARVVDAGGAPAAGVPVALRVRHGDEVMDFFRTLTDETGSARLRHLQFALEDGDVPPGTCVGLSMLAQEPMEFHFRGSLPTEALELALPSTGSLEIRIEDARGHTFAADGVLELALATSGPPDADQEWRRKHLGDERDDQRLRLFVREGRTVVERIGLGLSLAVSLSEVEGFQPFEVRAEGPRAVGEHKVVILRAPDLLSVLTAVLHDEGKPWVGGKLAVYLGEEAPVGSRWRSLETTVDSDGRLALTIDADWPREGRYSIELSAEGAEGDRHWTRWEQELVLKPGPNDLGEWLFEPLPILASGIVVEASGLTLAGAKVSLRVPRADGSEEEVASARTDTRGRFRVPGRYEGQRAILEVEREGSATRRLELEVGASDLVVSLARGGGVLGSLLVERAEALASLRVLVRDSSGHARRAELEEGRFRLRGLAAGPHTVEVALAEEPEFTLTVPNVMVTTGESTCDARLDPLDLRRILRTIEVTLVHPEDDTTFWTFIRRRPAGSGAYRDAAEWTLDDAIFTTGHPALDLRITAEGCRTVELLGISEDRTVGLRPAIPVTLKLSPPLALGPEEWLEVVLEGRDGIPTRRFFAPRFLDGEMAEASVPEPGAYVVRLAFLQQAVGDLRETPLSPQPELVLRVTDDDRPRSFEVPLSARALDDVARARADPPPR